MSGGAVFRSNWIKLPGHLIRGVGSRPGAMLALTLRPLRLYLALVDAAWSQRSDTVILRNTDLSKLTGIDPSDLAETRAKLVDTRLITATATNARGTAFRYRITPQEEMIEQDEAGSSWADATEDWARGVRG
jgi:hypothetical protein